MPEKKGITRLERIRDAKRPRTNESQLGDQRGSKKREECVGLGTDGKGEKQYDV